MPNPKGKDLEFHHRSNSGIYVPDTPVIHRDEEYNPAGFDLLIKMQERHFWYLGRHRFLLRAMQRELRTGAGFSRAIDLGGGCGGWIKYLQENSPHRFEELALGDSSSQALEMAAAHVGEKVRRYQIDLLSLQWRERWDVVFLLDVLEHIEEDAEALVRIRDALRPGGLLFVTAPALKFFWSYNDELSRHVRRYSRNDFHRLAKRSGLELRCCRYFMFLLSPLLFLSRFKRTDPSELEEEEFRKLLCKLYQTPAAPINRILHLVFAMETPWGLWLPFPWGTSILGVFAKR